MAPLIPRMHLFEIDDQPWFPAFLRARVQSALAAAWNTRVPLLQAASPSQLVADLLKTHLAPLDDYAFVDFCAGAGGPTPLIERELNRDRRGGGGKHEQQPVPFVLTDLHPHVADWAKAAAASPNITYEPSPVDAAAVPASLLERVRKAGTSSSAPRSSSTNGAGAAQDDSQQAQRRGATDEATRRQDRKIFRLFNLAFHHFDDPLAVSILKNTIDTSDGFGIFELQSRDSLGPFINVLLFGVGVLLCVPYYAFLWGDVATTLFFTYVIPVIPFVLVYDGWVSCLRTRTPDEVALLLRRAAADDEDGLARWEVRSGSMMVLWPFGHLNWIICFKKT